MIIAVSGTPGTGKTYISKKIAKSSKKLKYFDLNKYIKTHKLYYSYDKKDKTYDVDIKKLQKKINPLFKDQHSKNLVMNKLVGKTMTSPHIMQHVAKKFDGIIIDSHLSHYLDSDYCLIIRSDIKKIHKRLAKRKYSKNKIQDNVEAEIFESCQDEAQRLGRKVIIIQN